jgi:hypothetical protein
MFSGALFPVCSGPDTLPNKASQDVLGLKGYGLSWRSIVELFIMVKSMTVRLGEIDATRGDLTSMRQRPHKVRSVRQVGGGSEWKAMQGVTGDGNSRKNHAVSYGNRVEQNWGVLGHDVWQRDVVQRVMARRQF